MIVPSRGRPQSVAEMHAAVVEADTTIGTMTVSYTHLRAHET